ncbi:DUF4232 domain-containing protein [Streptomyces sp. NK08204]|uniref:DUF4232 domain-containing protein n=1 Tax=Streptomyces sp. NK08204 TaxID=2873260 RepID=UPI001CEC322F|nr:DUF4232 domain-containing protein [Streptomyces sp. NK08204]
MRAIPLTVTVLAAALALTACEGGSGGTGGSACRVDKVSVQVGPASVAPAAGDTGEVPVSITNQSAPCTLDRFPGVLLAAGGTEAPVPAQRGARPQKLRLAKGDSATFTITYVRGRAGDRGSLQAQTVKIGLPGSTTTRGYPWKYGPIAGENGTASRPNASVSAFQQVGD